MSPIETKRPGFQEHRSSTRHEVEDYHSSDDEITKTNSNAAGRLEFTSFLLRAVSGTFLTARLFRVDSAEPGGQTDCCDNHQHQLPSAGWNVDKLLDW